VSEPHPKRMLSLYRQNMDDFSLQQRDLFAGMTRADQAELLFLMLMHTNKIVQHVHSLIRPGEAETQDMPEPERTN
jgi:hypothetical protein